MTIITHFLAPREANHELLLLVPWPMLEGTQTRAAETV